MYAVYAMCKLVAISDVEIAGRSQLEGYTKFGSTYIQNNSIYIQQCQDRIPCYLYNKVTSAAIRQPPTIIHQFGEVPNVKLGMTKTIIPKKLIRYTGTHGTCT